MSTNLSIQLLIKNYIKVHAKIRYYVILKTISIYKYLNKITPKLINTWQLYKFEMKRIHYFHFITSKKIRDNTFMYQQILFILNPHTFSMQTVQKWISKRRFVKAFDGINAVRNITRRRNYKRNIFFYK